MRPARPRTERIALLDVDDRAIAHVGVFPWPRSVMADGLLRLKEFGAQAVVFDIEYLDSSPKGIDSVYLQRGLPRDFQRSFGDISSNVSDLFNAVNSGQLTAREAGEYAGQLTDLIGTERESLLGKAQGLARDNDRYLGQAARINGRVWATVNLQASPLEGEQAERRTAAKAKFSVPLEASPRAPTGGYKDVLAPIPYFLSAARGAGFTNVIIDPDGVRRRIALVRKVDGAWYTQLLMAPLLEELGNPKLALEPGELKLIGAKLPEGGTGDIDIPLDASGNMLIDWPKTNYFESYEHISFYALARLEELESSLDESLSALASLESWFLPDKSGTLATAYAGLTAAMEAVDAAAASRTTALADADTVDKAAASEEAFAAYLASREEVRKQAADFLASGAIKTLAADAGNAAAAAPGNAAALKAEAETAAKLAAGLSDTLAEIAQIREHLLSAFKGKICVVGRVDTGTTDIGVNPFHGEYINVGTHAAVADTILARSFIRPVGAWASVILAFLFAPLFVLTMGRFKPGVRIAVGLGGAAAVFFGTFALFAATGIFVGPLGATLAVILAAIVREAVDFVTTEKEKRFLRKAFGTYLSGDVVEEILADPSRLKLGGDKRLLTAVFTDIRSFSTISEQLAPEALVSLLNRYLSAMSDDILEEKGTIDKYEGDAIIAFFGAPLDLPDHAGRALRSAIRMKRTERELNKTFLGEGLTPMPLATRIGINTGDMVVGNMGTERKMDYTIMGNAVNLAARLEGVNKQYGSWILASGPAVEAAGSEFLVRRMDRVRVVGIFEPVQLYEVLDFAAEAPAELTATVELFHNAMTVFEAKDWTEAGKLFQAVLDHAPEDGPAKTYLERCAKFRKTPPVKDWDGVFNLTEK
jgi:adenylate cyclase